MLQSLSWANDPSPASEPLATEGINAFDPGPFKPKKVVVTALCMHNNMEALM